MMPPTDKEGLARKRGFSEEKMVSILRERRLRAHGHVRPAQSLAGEPAPFAICNAGRPEPANAPDPMGDPEGVAPSHRHVLRQDHRART